MSKIYQVTLNEQEKSDLATTTMDAHLDQVAAEIEELYRSVADEGEEIHDVRRQLELEQRLLKRSTKAIAVADHNRLTSLDDRVLQRVESNVLSKDLSNFLHSLAWRIRSRYPAEALRPLGLDTMPDRQVPRAVLGAAINVHERLLRPDPALVPRQGREPLDFPALAAELWEMVELVDAGLQAHADTREAAAGALEGRRDAQKRHRVVHRAILRRHQGACWLAGLDEVAERMRLKSRRTSSEDPETGESADSGEGPDDSSEPLPEAK